RLSVFLLVPLGAVAVALWMLLGVFVPWVSAPNILADLGSIHVLGRAVELTLASQQLIAILTLLLLGVINIFGVRTGAWVQNIFTVLKVGALLGIVGLGIWWSMSHSAEADPVQQARGLSEGGPWGLATLAIVSVMVSGPVFSCDA